MPTKEKRFFQGQRLCTQPRQPHCIRIEWNIGGLYDHSIQTETKSVCETIKQWGVIVVKVEVISFACKWKFCSIFLNILYV